MIVVADKTPEDELYLANKIERPCACGLILKNKVYAKHLTTGEHNRRMRPLSA